MKHFSNNWLRVLGGLLGVAGILFVSLRLRSHAQQIDFTDFSKITWLMLGLLAVSYGVANLILARAWWYLLRFLGIEPTFIWAVRTYGLSQLAKYVPGNIFHLAGRQSLGMAEGFRATPLIKSAAWELGMLVFAGATHAILILPIAFNGLSPWFSISIFITLLAMVRLILVRWRGSMMGSAFLLYVFFLAIAGTSFTVILSLVTPAEITLSKIPVFLGAYVIAWLVGFITPGAPAGIGVREMTLIFLLGGSVEQVDLLLAVVMARIVSMVGDFLYFGASTIFASKTAYR